MSTAPALEHTSAVAGPVLTVDVDAVVANYRFLASRVRPAKVAGVVKADAYGLGAIPIARALARAGCETFFVAHTEEGMALRDVLPNVLGPVVVLATLDVGNAVLLLAGLSFLGLGSQPPTPEWGAGVAEGTQYFQYWWIGTFPGLAIFTAVLAFNFLGDSLRDALDPQSSWAHGGDRE